MAHFDFTVEIIAPSERVWAVLMDVERWPEWTPSVTSAKRLEEGPLAVGSRTRIVQPKLMPAVWRVTQLDESTGIFTWVTGKPGIHVTATHKLGRVGDESRMTLSLRYSGFLGPLIAWQLKDLNWDYLTKESHGLKRHCEFTAAFSMPLVPLGSRQKAG
jgi:uncharacterized membrane protein